MYNVTKIREQFLAFSCKDKQGQTPIFFDGPGGSQVPKAVIQAMGDYLGCYNSNMGGHADAGRRTSTISATARKMAGAWLGCPAEQVVFGLNSTSLMFQFSRVLSRDWQAGDNIVLSSIDHFSNVSSWQTAGIDKGVEIRRIPLTADGGTLDLQSLETLIDENTRLVAVALASNVLGTRTHISPIIERTKAVGAFMVVDTVHAIVHEKVNATQMGCDLLFASSYKLGGAHLGMAYASNRVLDLPAYKVEPATEIRPFAFEQGTQSFEAKAGMIALIEYWANLGGIDGTLDERLQQAYTTVQQYEQGLSKLFLEYANQRPYFILYGKNTTEGRTPTFAFNLVKDGKVLDPANIAKWFGERNVALPSGNFYALDVVRHLDLVETGFLRVGFLHYSTADEIHRLFELLDEYVQSI